MKIPMWFRRWYEAAAIVCALTSFVYAATPEQKFYAFAEVAVVLSILSEKVKDA